jgi:hypothetical protein
VRITRVLLVAIFCALGAKEPAYTQPLPNAQAPVSAGAAVPELQLKATLHDSVRSAPSAFSGFASESRTAATAGTELLLDGGFEGGYYGGIQNIATYGVTGPWTWTNSPSALTPIWQNYGSTDARTGSFMAYFSPFGQCSTTLYQTVAIPSGVTAVLSYWVWIGTFEVGSTAYDTLNVAVSDLSGHVQSVNRLYSNADSSNTWVNHTIDLSAFAGKTVHLEFDTYEDATNSTIFLLDDVSMLASPGNASCVEDAYTMCMVNGRYKVTSHWRNQYENGAVANLSKSKLTDTTGAFWIDDANTYEYLIRFSTATDNGRVWIAIPTFTDVEFWVDVTDTVKGQFKEYHSAPGNETLIYDPSFVVYP